MWWTCLIWLLSAVALGTSTAALASAPQPALSQVQIVEGTIEGADHQTYRAIEFVVPPGMRRLEIDFSHDGSGIRTVVDLAVYGPAGFRGASGSNKSYISIGANDATPSYRPGPLEPGVWKLVLGFPNVRAVIELPGKSTAATRFTARFAFEPLDSMLPESAFLRTPLRQGAAWYRGDFHTHTAHSDGSCTSVSGQRVPCPAFKTLAAAIEQGLDFIAVTDHNTSSHFNALRELQDYFDSILILPGMELTTFAGHANVLGSSDLPDFLLPGGGAARANDVFRRARAQEGLVAINHPGLPSNEDCMGCGWSAATDWSLVDALEIVNGGSLLRFGSAEGPFSALAFWERLLDRGLRVTAIAGSDSHDPAASADRQVPVGTPRSVVFAEALSQRAIFAAVRAGRVFVDVGGTRSRSVDLRAVTAAGTIPMGGVAALPHGREFVLEVETRDVSGATLEIVRGDRGRHSRVSTFPIESEVSMTRAALRSTGCAGWLRADVRSASGELLLVSNPVYFSAATPMRSACSPDSKAP
jgi:hypothetical protein